MQHTYTLGSKDHLEELSSWLQGQDRAQGSLWSQAKGVFQKASHWAPKKGESIAGSFIQEGDPGLQIM